MSRSLFLKGHSGLLTGFGSTHFTNDTRHARAKSTSARRSVCLIPAVRLVTPPSARRPASGRCSKTTLVARAAPSPASYGGPVLMRSARSRLMFSRDAKAFLRSCVPRPVRTSPSDTTRNSVDNSLSLRWCSSWFEISFTFSSFCSRPRSSRPFHQEASAR